MCSQGASPGPPLAAYPKGHEPMTTTAALVALIAIAIISTCVLAGYIVHTTGTTTGIPDLGRAIGALLAAIITALTRNP